MKLSVVVPVFKEEENIAVFLQHILPVLTVITSQYEVIFAIDPSPDRTDEIVVGFHTTNPRIKLLRLSRRFGQPMATLAGLAYSNGDAVVVMDVDLQDPPDLIPEMVSKWQSGYDVVLPQRIDREGEPWLKRFVASLGYKIINQIADVEIPKNTGDFRLMSRRVVLEVLQLRESHGFLRGMVALVGFKQSLLPFHRPSRYAGKTKYNRFFGSLRIGFNGIFCFSTYALSLSTQLGFLIAGSSFAIALVYLVMKLSGFPFPLGNPTTVILILFLGGIQLISVGILGEYIGRIYEEVRSRPKYIIDKAIGFSEE